MATPIETPAIIDGQLVQNFDVNLISDASPGFAGEVASDVTGLPSVNAADNPLTVVAGGGLNVTVGGTGQKCIVQGQACDNFPATNYTCATASGSTRFDLLCMQYQKTLGDPYLATIESTGGVITPNVTVYHTFRGAQFQIISGTPGAGVPPGTPAGWAAVASIQVPASSGSIGTITMLLSSMGAALAAVIAASGSGAGVSSLNLLTGALAITSSDNSVTVAPSGSSVSLTVTPSGPTGNSIQQQAGIIFCSKYINIGTRFTGFEPSSDDHIVSYPTFLGGATFLCPGDPAVTGGSTTELHFKVRVKPGAGGQVVGAQLQSSANAAFVAIDGSTVFSMTTSALSASWSGTIPDDGTIHTVIIHFDKSAGSNILLCEVEAWLPAGSNGGLDISKFNLATGGF